MLTFKEVRQKITEDEQLDRDFRNKALTAFRQVQSTLLRNRNSLGEIFFLRDDGGIIATGDSFGFVSDEPYLIMLPSDPRINGSVEILQDGGKSIPAIVLYCLNGPHDLEDLDRKLDQRTFVHEYIHYLDWDRAGRDRTKLVSDHGKVIDDNSYRRYVNTPLEFNAHYQEIVSHLEALAQSEPPHRLRGLFGTSAHEFVELAKQRHFPREYILALNQDYTRRLEKRLARFWNDTLEPMFIKRAEQGL